MKNKKREIQNLKPKGDNYRALILPDYNSKNIAFVLVGKIAECVWELENYALQIFDVSAFRRKYEIGYTEFK